MENKYLYCVFISLIFIGLLSGCTPGKKDNFPRLPEQVPDSVIIENGVMGVDLPPVEDKSVINDLIELIGNTKYIAVDSTEIIGGGYGIKFVYSDSTIEYYFPSSEYVSVRINESAYTQYKIEQKDGSALYNYLENYVTEDSE